MDDILDPISVELDKNQEITARMTKLVSLCAGAVPAAAARLYQMEKEKAAGPVQSLADQWKQVNHDMEQMNRSFAAALATMNRLGEGKAE